MKNIFLSILLLLFAAISFAQVKPQQLDPSGANCNVVILAGPDGNYNEYCVDSGECVGDDYIITYAAIKSSATYPTLTTTLPGACTVGDDICTDIETCFDISVEPNADGLDELIIVFGGTTYTINDTDTWISSQVFTNQYGLDSLVIYNPDGTVQTSASMNCADCDFTNEIDTFTLSITQDSLLNLHFEDGSISTTLNLKPTIAACIDSLATLTIETFVSGSGLDSVVVYNPDGSVHETFVDTDTWVNSEVFTNQYGLDSLVIYNPDGTVQNSVDLACSDCDTNNEIDTFSLGLVQDTLLNLYYEDGSIASSINLKPSIAACIDSLATIVVDVFQTSGDLDSVIIYNPDGTTNATFVDTDTWVSSEVLVNQYGLDSVIFYNPDGTVQNTFNDTALDCEAVENCLDEGISIVQEVIGDTTFVYYQNILHDGTIQYDTTFVVSALPDVCTFETVTNTIQCLEYKIQTCRDAVTGAVTTIDTTGCRNLPETWIVNANDDTVINESGCSIRFQLSGNDNFCIDKNGNENEKVGSYCVDYLSSPDLDSLYTVDIDKRGWVRIDLDPNACGQLVTSSFNVVKQCGEVCDTSAVNFSHIPEPIGIGEVEKSFVGSNPSNPSQIANGESGVFTIQYCNTGLGSLTVNDGSALDGVTDSVDPCFTIDNTTNSIGDVTVLGQLVEWDNFTLAAGDCSVFTIEVTKNCDDDYIQNAVSAVSDNGTGEGSNSDNDVVPTFNPPTSDASIVIDDTDGNSIELRGGIAEACDGNVVIDCSDEFFYELDFLECKTNTLVDGFSFSVDCASGVHDFVYTGSGLTLSAADQTALEAEFSVSSHPFVEYDKEALHGILTAAYPTITGADCPTFEHIVTVNFEDSSCLTSNSPMDTVKTFHSTEGHRQVLDIDEDLDGSIIACDHLYGIFRVSESGCTDNEHCGYRSLLLIDADTKTPLWGVTKTIETVKDEVVNGHYALWGNIGFTGVGQALSSLNVMSKWTHAGNDPYWDSTLNRWVEEYDLVEYFNPQSGLNTNTTAIIPINEFEIDTYLGKVNGKVAFWMSGSLAAAQLYHVHWDGTQWVINLVSNPTLTFSGAIYPEDGDTFLSPYRNSVAGTINGLEHGDNGDLFASLKSQRTASTTSTSTRVLWQYSGGANLADRINGANYTWNIIAGETGWGNTDGVGTSAQFSNNNSTPSEDLIWEGGVLYTADYLNRTYRSITPNGGTSADISDNWDVNTILGNGVNGFEANGTGLSAQLGASVYEIYSHSHGNWYIGTNTGIFKVNPATLDAKLIEGGKVGTTETTVSY